MKKPITLQDWEEWKQEQEMWNAHQQEQHEARMADMKAHIRQQTCILVFGAIEIAALLAIFIWDVFNL